MHEPRGHSGNGCLHLLSPPGLQKNFQLVSESMSDDGKTFPRYSCFCPPSSISLRRLRRPRDERGALTGPVSDVSCVKCVMCQMCNVSWASGGIILTKWERRERWDESYLTTRGWHIVKSDAWPVPPRVPWQWLICKLPLPPVQTLL